MSFVLRAPDTDIDLGPSMDVLKAFQEIARVEPGEELGQLHYVPHTNEEEMPEEYLTAVAEQARTCLERHRAELDENAVGVLEMLGAVA